MGERKSVALRVNVTPGQHGQLLEIAGLEDVSVAHVVRKAIAAFLSGTDIPGMGRTHHRLNAGSSPAAVPDVPVVPRVVSGEARPDPKRKG